MLLGYLSDLVIALLFANLLLTMKVCPSLKPPPLAGRHATLAAFSFSLYAIHTPILNAYAAWLMQWSGMGWKMVPAGPLPYLLALSAIALSVGTAYLFSLATERHTAGLHDVFLRLRPSRGVGPSLRPSARRENSYPRQSPAN